MGSISSDADSKVYSQVSSHYGNAARSSGGKEYSSRVANAFGYSATDLEGMPEDANLGLSCGNPIALAGLKEGETVVDLGSGAGFDVFQAAKKVGGKGRAVGVDFSRDMLSRANAIKSTLNAENVEFIDANITRIPALRDGSVDVVISNCVINLVPESQKPLVFAEMHRILRSGGRVAISDILAKAPLPDHVRDSMAMYVGCIAGASQLEEYERWMKEVGFADVVIVDAKSDLNVYGQTEGGEGPCCGPSEKQVEEKKKDGGCCGGKKEEKNVNGDSMAKFRDVDFNQFAGSYKIYAVKA